MSLRNPVRMRLVLYNWVMSHTNESCHVRIIYVTLGWVMSYAKRWCSTIPWFVCECCVTYEWVLSVRLWVLCHVQLRHFCSFVSVLPLRMRHFCSFVSVVSRTNEKFLFFCGCCATYEWVMSFRLWVCSFVSVVPRTNESCLFVCECCATYEWVISVRLWVLCHVRMRHFCSSCNVTPRTLYFVSHILCHISGSYYISCHIIFGQI